MWLCDWFSVLVLLVYVILSGNYSCLRNVNGVEFWIVGS